MTKAFLRNVLLISSAIYARAVLEVRTTNQTNTTTNIVGSFETAVYIHFGPDDETIVGQIIRLDGDALCEPGSAVRGKIVVSFMSTTGGDSGRLFCSRHMQYAALNVSNFETMACAMHGMLSLPKAF